MYTATLTLMSNEEGEKMGVKILSLYDGMACGMIAMQLAGVEVESYDAYEIDKYAIKTAQHNRESDFCSYGERKEGAGNG